MILAADYPFLDAFWTMLVFFAFVIWIWLLFDVFADVFRRRDASGWVKVLWIAFVILLPFLGVFVYIIAEQKGMTERKAEAQAAAQSQLDSYVRSVASRSDGAPADRIAKAKQLLDSGAISQSEYEELKRKALAEA